MSTRGQFYVRMAFDLRRAGWKVRQVAGRRIWYKGRPGAEITATGLDHAWNMEHMLRRCNAPSMFMWGLDAAELLGAVAPDPVAKAISPQKRNKAAAALEALDSFTGTTQMDQAIFARVSEPARKLLESML